MTQLFKCQGCGGAVSPAENNCPACGRPLAGLDADSGAVEEAPAALAERRGSAPSHAPDAPRPRKRRRIGLIIGIVAGVSIAAVLIIIVGGAGVGFFLYGEAASEREEAMVALEAEAIESAVQIYLVKHGSGCPTVTDLQDEGLLSPGVSGVDPWGNDFVIECDGESVSVYSLGPVP